MCRFEQVSFLALLTHNGSGHACAHTDTDTHKDSRHTHTHTQTVTAGTHECDHIELQ